MLIRKFLQKYSETQKLKRFINTVKQLSHPDIFKAIEAPDIHFKHSGPLGDIIYSIPAMKMLAKDKNICLHINTNQNSYYNKKLKHYGEGKTVTTTSATQLVSLLEKQEQFKVCDEYQNQPIDYDLDLFRQYPFDYRMGNITRWQFLIYGINADTFNPWLKVTPDPRYNKSVVISRSFRYRTPLLSYSFLSRYNNLIFIGLKDEYEDIKKDLPDIIYKPVKDFLELAQIIAGAKLFIGNQSFPFSIAEALKVKRVLEVSFESPNVIVEGLNGYDFCYQPQFEKIIKHLLD